MVNYLHIVETFYTSLFRQEIAKYFCISSGFSRSCFSAFLNTPESVGNPYGFPSNSKPVSVRMKRINC